MRSQPPKEHPRPTCARACATADINPDERIREDHGSLNFIIVHTGDDECFVQVGRPFGPNGQSATAEDYLRAAFEFAAMGGDCYNGAASLEIRKSLCDKHMPVVAHVGLIPSFIARTGWRALAMAEAATLSARTGAPIALASVPG